MVTLAKAPLRLRSCVKPFPVPGTATSKVGAWLPGAERSGAAGEHWDEQREHGQAPVLLAGDGASALSPLAGESSGASGNNPSSLALPPQQRSLWMS